MESQISYSGPTNIPGTPAYRPRVLGRDEVLDHIDRIMRMEVGDRYSIEEAETPQIVEALKSTPLGGRRFQTYKEPHSFRMTLLRDRDQSQESILEEQRKARLAAQQAQQRSERHLAEMRNAATMAGFHADVADHREKKAEVVVVDGPRPEAKKPLKYALRDRWYSFLLSTPFFKEAE